MGDAGDDVPDPHRAGRWQPAWVRDHRRGSADFRWPGPAARRDAVHGAGPAARGRADRGGPGGDRGGPAAPVLPAHPGGNKAAGGRGGPAAGQRQGRADAAEAVRGGHMSDISPLERGYRRVLACYPKAFRRESEEEILAVLMATAHEGQRRAGLAESADLIRGALRMHFGLSRAPRPVRNAVRFMCLGAVLTLADVVTFLVTLGGVRSAAVHDLAATQWPTVVLTQVGPWLASGPIGAGLWLWLAWANGRGYHWARPAFTTFFLVLTIVLFFGIGQGTGEDALPYTWADVIAATVLWLVALAAALLIVGETASPYYQRRAATRA